MVRSAIAGMYGAGRAIDEIRELRQTVEQVEHRVRICIRESDGMALSGP
jgi:hypothetical protein